MEHDAHLIADAVTLHPLTMADVSDRYVGWLNDPAVTAGTEIRFARHTPDGVRDYVARTLASSNDKMWKIVSDGHGHVGNIRLSSINAIHRHARIAILIGERSVWGKGIGSAAIALASRHGFEAMGLHKLTAGIYTTNPGSRRAFEKAEYEIEATLKDEALVDGRFIDVWLMARFAAKQDQE